MSTLAPTSATLADAAKRLDPDGSIASVAEILNQKNEILDDMMWIEGNMPTGHRGTVRTGLPEGTWRPSHVYHSTFEACFQFSFGVVCGTVKESVTPSGEYQSSFKSH